jgi:DNA polymerase-4
MVDATTRRILHCDMDSFYAAVHIREDSRLEGRPVVVGGDPDGRGVVAAASYEARKFGIHSAMPAARARRLCPDVVFIRPDFRRYRAEAEKIFAIYREYTLLIQALSLDEAFLDVTDQFEAFGSATAIAQRIRARVRSERKLTVSVGAGPNKLVAKIASDFDKPDGLTVVRPSAVADFLLPLPVRRLHGIGPATERVLLGMGVQTVAELRELTLDRLLARFGHWGRTLWEHSRGIDDRPVRNHSKRKSLSTERTFPEDVTDLGTMDLILEEMAEEVAEGLEHRRLGACTVTVKVRYPDFRTLTRSHSLGTPTTSAPTIARCAQTLVRRTDAASRSVRLLGVGASRLVQEKNPQLALFDTA